MLFSRYEKRALRAFFRSAENEKIDISEIDEKFEKIAEKSRRKKGLLNDIKNLYVKQFRFLKKILKLDAKEKETYRRERLRLILEIENFRGEYEWNFQYVGILFGNGKLVLIGVTILEETC